MPSTRRKRPTSAGRSRELVPIIIPPAPPMIRKLRNVDVRQRAEEVWKVVNELIGALDVWQQWFRELRARGDADPGVAWRCSEISRRCIHALYVQRVNAAPFDREDEEDVLAILPPLPHASMGGISYEWDEERQQSTETTDVRWQDDPDLRYGYYSQGRCVSTTRLRGFAFGIRKMLEKFPLTALDRGGSGNVGSATPMSTSSAECTSVVLEPAPYLFSWAEILKALDMKNTAENQGRVRRLTRKYDGPIKLPTRGAQPEANRSTLLAWWNKLRIGVEEADQKRVNAQATVRGQHNYGRVGKVVPGISGHVKKRRHRGSQATRVSRNDRLMQISRLPHKFAVVERRLVPEPGQSHQNPE